MEEACSEVEYILNNFEQKSLDKIPKRLINFFEENKSKTYKVELDTKKELDEQKLKDETRVILKILYMKYLATNEEKEEFEGLYGDIEDYINGNNNESQIDFAKRKIDIKEKGEKKEEKEELSLQVYKKSTIVSKMFEKIRKIFKLKK